MYCDWCKRKTDNPKKVFIVKGNIMRGINVCWDCNLYYDKNGYLPIKRKRGK